MITLTDENFDETIRTSQKPVLVDFMALWCPPCSILKPILENLEKEFGEKVIFAKVNVDLVPKTCQKLGINPIPTVILFKEGKPISGFFGVRPEGEIRKWLEENLKNNEKEKIEKIIEEYEEYAQKNNYRLNPNREVVERIIRGLLENERKYGFRYCPCRRISGNLEEDKPKICPCQFRHEEVEKNGHCLCGLFVK